MHVALPAAMEHAVFPWRLVGTNTLGDGKVTALLHIMSTLPGIREDSHISNEHIRETFQIDEGEGDVVVDVDPTLEIFQEGHTDERERFVEVDEDISGSGGQLW